MLLDGTPVEIDAARVDAVRAMPSALLPAGVSGAFIRAGVRRYAVRLDTSGGKTPEAALAELEEAIGKARVPSGLLWEWNGADASQFGAPVGFKNDLGGGPQGAPAVGVVASLRPRSGGAQVLEVGAPAAPEPMAGGWMFPATVIPGAAEIELDLDNLSQENGCTAGLYVGTAGPVLNGLVFRRRAAIGGLDMLRVIAGKCDSNSLGLATVATPTTANLTRGLDRLRVRVRMAAETPVRWTVEAAHHFGALTGGMASSEIANGAPPEWAGLELSTVGLVIYNATAYVHNWAHFSRFAIYEAGARL